MGIEKNSIVKANRFLTIGSPINMETKNFEGADWVKILDHNNQAGTVRFTTLDECLNSDTTDKYSKLYLLDYFKNANDKYEFLLQYPDDVQNKYNRWKQNNNPCKEFVPTTSSGDGKAEGYEAIHIDWSGHYWGGLTRNNSSETTITNCYLSGSVGHTNWWFAVAATNFYQGGVPGPSVVITGRTQLWVRIDNLSDDVKCKITKFCIVANDFYEV